MNQNTVFRLLLPIVFQKCFSNTRAQIKRYLYQVYLSNKITLRKVTESKEAVMKFFFSFFFDSKILISRIFTSWLVIYISDKHTTNTQRACKNQFIHTSNFKLCVTSEKLVSRQHLSFQSWYIVTNKVKHLLTDCAVIVEIYFYRSSDVWTERSLVRKKS